MLANRMCKCAGEDMSGDLHNSDVSEQLLDHVRLLAGRGLETVMPRALHCETFQILFMPLLSIGSENVLPPQFVHDALQRMLE